jgi:hypothetical protein
MDRGDPGVVSEPVNSSTFCDKVRLKNAQSAPAIVIEERGANLDLRTAEEAPSSSKCNCSRQHAFFYWIIRNHGRNLRYGVFQADLHRPRQHEDPNNAFAKPLRIFLMAHSKLAQQHGDVLPNKNYRTHTERS